MAIVMHRRIAGRRGSRISLPDRHDERTLVRCTPLPFSRNTTMSAVAPGSE